MKAVVYRKYGPADVAHWEDIEEPRCGPAEMLVAVEAAALNPKDVLVRKGKYALLSGKQFPKRLGLDFAGRVTAVGPGVPNERLGKRVFGFFGGFRALRGSLVDRVVVTQGEVAVVADRVSAEDAAATGLAGSTALQALRDDGKLQRGERVLVIGASGGVGSFAVQLAKKLGATVAASASVRNRELLVSLGADQVLDYASQRALGDGPYDLVLDCFGKARADALRPVLAPGGRFVSLVPSAGIVGDIARGVVSGPRTRLTAVRSRQRDLALLASWLDDGSLRPSIERVYARDELIEAMQHLETRRARGKLVVRM
ncbi:MAG: NAD(P)-dependent alcohol dehydrogenase [Myxococcales bacterium]